MIDIHSHILPGLDDGAKTIDDSLEMAKSAVNQGIHTIIATPHHCNGSFNNYKSDILLHTETLNEQLQNAGIPLSVLTGQETRIHGEMVEKLSSAEMATLNQTNYLLVEFPSTSVPRYAKEVLFQLQVAGYRPIIAHPERNTTIMEHPSILFEFVKNGALTQITAASLIGMFGKSTHKFSHQLIEANLTHFIASDAHNTTTRGFVMKEAYEELQKKHGKDVYHLFIENPQLLIDGKKINHLEPVPIQKKKFLGLF